MQRYLGRIWWRTMHIYEWSLHNSFYVHNWCMKMYISTFWYYFCTENEKKWEKKANYFWAGLPFIPFSVPHDLGLEQFQLFTIKWHKIWLGHRLTNPESLSLTFLFNACLATCILIHATARFVWNMLYESFTH